MNLNKKKTETTFQTFPRAVRKKTFLFEFNLLNKCIYFGKFEISEG